MLINAQTHPNTPMKVALIGGEDAALHYATVSARMPQLEFTAVVATDGAAAKRAATILSAGHIASSLAEMLAGNGGICDAVLIHQAAGTAEQSALAAAAAGKHVLLGAPIAASSDAAAAVIAACSAAGVTLMAGQTWRFRPSQAAIKKSLDDGSLGAPGLLRVHVWQGSRRATEALVMNDGVQALDLATWLFSVPPTEIYAVGRPGYAQIHCGFPAGGMAVIDCTNAIAAGGEYFSSSVVAATGAAYADDHHNRNLLFGDGAPRALDAGEGSFAQIAQLAEFVAAIQQRRLPAVSGADGKLSLELAEAALVSLRNERPVARTAGGYELN